MNQPHIVIVEDCVSLRETIALYLRNEGYRVSVAGDGQGLRAIASREPIDLAIVDLMLPDEDGLSLTRYLSEHHHCGIIILTGTKDAMNCVIGLEVGADDYVSKPCESRELLARIRSVLRRAKATATWPQERRAHNVVSFANLRLDLNAHQLSRDDDDVIDLTTGEFNLLREFTAKPGRVLSREQLMRAVHNRSWDYADRSIDVLVTRLRRKLEPAKGQAPLIKTIRGAGYMFTAPVNANS